MKKEKYSGSMSEAGAEKKAVALSSVIAALGLTGMKIVVGFMTNSLGILAEAAHSALDLVAALVTWFAVSISERPPDLNHNYGHGKVENLSAFFETILLVLTCVWIIWEAVTRLITGTEVVEVTFWSFAVMLVSIFVDISRSRMLSSAAKKYRSQALEADALHFKTDIWSSSVVILGLLCVSLASYWPSLSILRQADAIAAIIVAFIALTVSWRLGWRTVEALLDTAPEGMVETIKKAVEDTPGVADCHNIRTRYSGSRLFIDIHVLVDGNQSLRDAHDLTDQIEGRLKIVLENIDVTVHPEPMPEEQEDSESK